jgi:hypothetical protein
MKKAGRRSDRPFVLKYPDEKVGRIRERDRI